MKCRNIILKNIKKMSNKYNKIIIQDHIIDIPSLGKISETSLTRDSKIFIEDNGLPNTFVPGRNLLFFNYASALGWRRNIFDLVGGMCDTDYSGYPDCRRETINSLKQTLSLGLDKKIFIHTPLMDLNKADIWRLGYDLGGEKFQNILIEDTHTCYVGDRSTLHDWGYGCGLCPACILRKDGYNEWIKHNDL